MFTPWLVSLMILNTLTASGAVFVALHVCMGNIAV